MLDLSSPKFSVLHIYIKQLIFHVNVSHYFTKKLLLETIKDINQNKPTLLKMQLVGT